MLLEFGTLSFVSRLDEDSFVALLINDEVHSYDQVATVISGVSVTCSFDLVYFTVLLRYAILPSCVLTCTSNLCALLVVLSVDT